MSHLTVLITFFSQEIERKNEAQNAGKVTKRVRFLLPGELEHSPVRKKRRTNESGSMPEKSAPPSSPNVPPRENRADPVMPGAYEIPPDVENGDKGIESCPVIDHIFSFLREQLAASHFRDNKRAEGDYPV